MRECQIKPYIAEVTADKLEQQRLNSIHNEVFRRLSSSKLFNNWNGKLWEYKNKGVTAINKGRQLVGQINRNYGQVVVRSGQPVRVDVRSLLNPNTITIQQGNQYVSEGEVYPTYEDAIISEDIIADIYSEIGLNKNALINQEYINEVQTKLDEYNSLNTGKELSLREVGSTGKHLISEQYKVNYLYSPDNSVIENISEEYSPTTSNSNFSCL